MTPDPYNAYASIYDRTGQARFGGAMAQLTLAWLAKQECYPQAVLDLATGTGAGALEFARAGLEVVAIDSAPAMLDKARGKADLLGIVVDFRVGDVRDFSIDRQVPLITSFFDSLNYVIEESELANVFRCVATALEPGGWFVFDLNTLHRFNSVWNNSIEIAYQDDDTLVIYRSSFDIRTGISPLVLTAFEREEPGSNLWRRWDETHVERGYLLSDVEMWLRAAGLQPISIEELNERTMSLQGPATEQSPRAVFFAQRMIVEPEPNG